MDEADLQALQNQPSIAQLESILFKPVESPMMEFRLVNIILNCIVGLYDDLTPSLRKQIRTIFTSLNGINALLTQLKLTSATDAAIHTIAKLLTEVVDQNHLLYIILSKESSPLKFNEIKNRFFGSKIANAFAALFVEAGIETKYSNIKNYTEKLKADYLYLLKKDFNDYHYLSSLLVSYLRLSDEQTFLILADLASMQFINQFIKVYDESKSNRGPIALSLIKFLNYATRHNLNCQDFQPILCHMHLDFTILQKAVEYSNMPLLQLLVASVEEHGKFEIFMKSLQIWGNSTYINKTPLSLQESYTDLLVVLLNSLKTDKILRISQDPEFLGAITNRISSTTGKIRSLGMLIGNSVFHAMDKEPIFKIEEELDFQKDYLRRFENSAVATQAVEYDISDTSKDFTRLVIQESDEEVDDDPEDSDDDPTIVDRSKPNKPLFLKELISYLTVDSKKDKHSYDKRKLALQYGPKLILRSSIKNLRFYNESLISLFIGLSNEFEDADFDDLRLKCLISCCVQDPYEAPTVILRNFIAGDYSLQQRLTLLSTISLSSRYLRGYNDENFSVDESKTKFKSKMLPPAVHAQFMRFEGKLPTNLIETSLESEIVDETMVKNKEKILGEGNVLRISQKLSKPKERSTEVVKTRVADFYKIVSSKFFFPMTSVWFSLNQEGSFKIGKFSAILTAHFLRSIGLVLHTAFPSSPNLQDIVKESLNIVISVSVGMFRIRQSDENNDDLLVLNAVLFIVLVILDSSNEQFLVNFYLEELVTIKNFMVGLLNEEIDAIAVDNALLQKCFTVTFRLNEIFEKFESYLTGMEGIQ